MRKVLRNGSSGSSLLLRDMLVDAGSGAVKPARMSALLNAALGHVAERADGFVDLDAVPADGAPLRVRSRCVWCSLSQPFTGGLPDTIGKSWLPRGHGAVHLARMTSW